MKKGRYRVQTLMTPELPETAASRRFFQSCSLYLGLSEDGRAGAEGKAQVGHIPAALNNGLSMSAHMYIYTAGRVREHGGQTNRTEK